GRLAGPERPTGAQFLDEPGESAHPAAPGRSVVLDGLGQLVEEAERLKRLQAGDLVEQRPAVGRAGLEDWVAGPGLVQGGHDVVVAQDEQVAVALHDSAERAGAACRVAD